MSVSNVVYVSGALTDVPHDKRQQYIEFCESIGHLITAMDLRVYVPHWNTDPVKHKDVTPKQVDLIDRTAVTSAMLVIAVVDNPSLGVGIEVEMAYHANKPVVLLCKQDLVEARKISRLVRGNPAVIREIIYSDFEEARSLLGVFLDSFLKELRESVLPATLVPALSR